MRDCSWRIQAISGILLVQVLCCQAQQYGFSASITNLSAQVQTTYNWGVTNDVDKSVISVSVGDNNGYATVQYTVSYTRTRNAQQTYVLTGTISVQDTDGQANVITLPVVTRAAGRRTKVKLPSRSVSCPSLTLPANGQISCTFTASYTGDQPLPGSVSASVTLPDTTKKVTTPSVPYDFAGAEMTEAGGLATISSYFEQGQGLLQPYGVSGSQPPPGLTINDDATFTFTAYYGNIPASECDQQQWTAVNTASVQPSASSTSSRRNNNLIKAASSVTINLVDCSGPAFSSTTGSPGTVAVPAAPPPAVPPPAAPVVANPAPSGITFAEAGSILCGSGVCPPGQRCFDGFSCCDSATNICGGVCCDGGRVCISNQCAAAGSTICGTTVCPTGQVCTDNVCCPSTQKVCNGVCCQLGQDCILGQCAATGSTACGNNVCTPTQQCVGGSVCCSTGETVCAGLCCGSGNTCLGNQFCVPAGSTLCGGTVCPAPQQCAGGALCCDVGATFCGGSCCPSGSTCQGNRCLAAGTTLCGNSNVCTSTQTCQGNAVCCDQGATFCNNGCCAQGNVCINNQCVATGSSACGPTVICTVGQFCGNPNTGTCCQTVTQIGCFTTCCQSPQQFCNQITQQCVSRVNNACAPGTTWCPSANICCPVGQLCYLGQCVASNAVPAGGVITPYTPVYGRRLGRL